MGENIHCTAVVDPLAKIADNFEIGSFSIIHANVELASGCKIDAYCELGIESSFSDGFPLIIEKDSVIKSHSAFFYKAPDKVGDSLQPKLCKAFQRGSLL